MCTVKSAKARPGQTPLPIYQTPSRQRCDPAARPFSPQSPCNLSTVSATDFQAVNVGASGSVTSYNYTPYRSVQ